MKPEDVLSQAGAALPLLKQRLEAYDPDLLLFIQALTLLVLNNQARLDRIERELQDRGMIQQ